MKSIIRSLTLGALIVAATGCASDKVGSSRTAFPSRYATPDGRHIVIGERSEADGGWQFRDPHLEKCWISNGMNFSGYDTLYIVPTLSTAKFSDDQKRAHDLTKENLQIEFRRAFESMGLFTNVVTRESDVRPGARVLKMENTIIDYSKGDRAARAFVGLYGGGQPVLRVSGKVLDGEKPVFTYTVHRSGTSAGSRMAGMWIHNDDIQTEDIRSMVLDTSDVIAAIAGKYQPER